MDISGRLLEIEQPSGRLVVNFSERFVSLIREVRLLTTAGFRVPEAIIKRADSAKRVYDYGTVLMQVAHFYNTIDQQMIRCQKPMLLDSAKRFERLIKEGRVGIAGTKSGSDISWDNMREVQDYVADLQEAVTQ